MFLSIWVAAHDLGDSNVDGLQIGLPGYEGVLLSEVVSNPKRIKGTKGIGPQPNSAASLSGPRLTLQHLTRYPNLRATGGLLCTLRPGLSTDFAGTTAAVDTLDPSCCFAESNEILLPTLLVQLITRLVERALPMSCAKSDNTLAYICNKVPRLISALVLVLHSPSEVAL